MLSQFCIRRPIFASVMSILIVLAGLVCARILPLSQYPDISPPSVSISTSYEGADAQTLARTIAAPIEDQLSGIEGLQYYTTSLRSNGDVRISCRLKSESIRMTPCLKSITVCVQPKDGCPRRFVKTG